MPSAEGIEKHFTSWLYQLVNNFTRGEGAMNEVEPGALPPFYAKHLCQISL